MKIKDIIKEGAFRDIQRDILLRRITAAMAETDDPTELDRLVARYNKLFKDSESTIALAKVAKVAQDVDQEGGVAQGMDQADEITTPPPGTAVAKPNTPPPGTEKERGAGYELTRAQAERDEYLQRQAKELARMKANAGMKDSDYKTSPGSKRTAQDMAPDKANADMKDSDYKTSPGSKRTAQDLALDKEYTYKAPDGRRLKYKHGDIRNAFHSSPDSRKAGSDKVIRGDRVGKRLVDKEPVRRTNQNQDDRAK